MTKPYLQGWFWKQYGLNQLNSLDHVVNGLLFGDPNETISARTARARKDGAPWAIHACNILTFLAKIVTFGNHAPDHCYYSLDDCSKPCTAELLDVSNWEWREQPGKRIEDIIEEEANQGML